MADDRDVTIRLQLDLSPDQPGLLEGLDTWLRLGLMSEQQVRELGQTHLSCELRPELSSVASSEMALADAVNPFVEATEEAAVAGDAPITDFVSAAPATRRRRQQLTRPA
ncbi:hypothetical protein IQ273_25165, partial [Nodosilinea sp. LEGE 07298]|uniref:hypothetical protein n=1 Tax=Nodosilinea sp. LEGE 07298 TaxID=2777970 RepID=UPI00187E5377